MAARRPGSAEYDGVINISIEPNRVAAGFADLVSERADVVRVIRTDGEILAQIPGFSAPLPPLTPQIRPSFFKHATGARARTLYQTSRPLDGADQLIAMRAIPGFNIYSTVARDTSAIYARWWRGFAQHLGLGIPAILLVAATAIYASRRAEELERAQAAARFHAVFDASPVGLAVLSAHSGDLLSSNEALADLLKLPREAIEGKGLGLRSLIPPELVEKYDSAMDLLLARDTADAVDVELLASDRRRVPVRIAMSKLPGDPPRIVAAVQDVTDVREAEGRRELIMREMEHRAKNTLAVIQAALRLGASGATDAQALAKAVEARVAALGRSQSLLTSVGEGGASLRSLIEQEVAPFAPPEAEHGKRLSIEGPEIRVTARTAQALTMTFHELATNAAKYGAFASKAGRLNISWEIARPDEFLVLRWRETGSAVEEPVRVGFGTRLIDTNVQHQLGGMIERHWGNEGLLVEMRLPLKRIMQRAEERRPQ
jgi:PAS domain S-box-containing protein